MSSMQYCYKPAKETCEQKCLDSCYGHTLNDNGSYHDSCGQAYSSEYHIMTKSYVTPNSYGQPHNHQTMTKPNNMRAISSQGHHVMDYMTVGRTELQGQNQCMGQTQYGHGNSNGGHGHEGQQYYYGASHGVASCAGKSTELNGSYYYEKNNKSFTKIKHKEFNRSCGDNSGSDSD